MEKINLIKSAELKQQIKTHIVLDLMYTVEEGQETFSGSYDECEDFISEQGSCCSSMYKIVPIIKRNLD